MSALERGRAQVITPTTEWYYTGIVERWVGRMSGREPLRFEEREIISRELSQGRNPREISETLGRRRSTIYDEIKRNGGVTKYRVVEAQARADANLARPKARKLEASARLHDAVNDGLRQKWSPEQISKRLRADHPDDPEMRASHETIYEGYSKLT